MARLRSVQADFHIKRVNLRSLIQEVNNDNNRLFIRKKVYREIEEEKQNMMVETDEKWLFFIFSQIIQDAVKYTAQESDKVFIHLYRRPPHVVCAITDYGVGIRPEDRQRIFDLFFTGRNGREMRKETCGGMYLIKHVD